MDFNNQYFDRINSQYYCINFYWYYSVPDEPFSISTVFMSINRYMFPHLLQEGNGTDQVDKIKVIDSQAGVIQINNKIHWPMHMSIVQTMQQSNRILSGVLHVSLSDISG